MRHGPTHCNPPLPGMSNSVRTNFSQVVFSSSGLLRGPSPRLRTWTSVVRGLEGGWEVCRTALRRLSCHPWRLVAPPCVCSLIVAHNGVRSVAGRFHRSCVSRRSHGVATDGSSLPWRYWSFGVVFRCEVYVAGSSWRAVPFGSSSHAGMQRFK